MNLLAIETSSPILSVAIKKGRRAVREAVLKGYARHAENLLPLIDRLLRREGFGIRDIDAFLIGRGPGSFTGLRVGFATLKGFLACRKKPCYGALAPDLIAGGFPACKMNKLHVCLDAKRDKLYVRSYRYHDRAWKPQKAVAALSLEAFSSRLNEDCCIAGDGIATDRCRILSRPERKLLLAAKKYWHPRASTLIAFFATKNPMLRALKDPKDFLPVYIRKSEAEERLKAAKFSLRGS
ncbi:MAG: tRNA (adenosine(37)-N6)-threonylcarbamoyltransferase complex dimerization subunit type 1 TsaB [Candidatus Omnitrophica bacterium]|nr:tRNA (adenosine(37)-N6)-threonylcarbamoyltransferase complex dimerization subunit type 1 TsaB [Candidatus Omnitrophota bacterium]